MLLKTFCLALVSVTVLISYGCSRVPSKPTSALHAIQIDRGQSNQEAELQSLVANQSHDKFVLLPLTEMERALDPRKLITYQPDFVADLQFFRSEPRGGYGGAVRIARRGNRFRHENEFAALLGEPGKPSISLHKSEKVYVGGLPARSEVANGIELFDPRTLAAETGVTFTVLGAVMIEEQRLLKIRAKRRGRSERIFLFAAPALKNLIVIAQIVKPPFGFIQRLQNVSFEVSSVLFEISTGYKATERVLK